AQQSDSEVPCHRPSTRPKGQPPPGDPVTAAMEYQIPAFAGLTAQKAKPRCRAQVDLLAIGANFFSNRSGTRRSTKPASNPTTNTLFKSSKGSETMGAILPVKSEMIKRRRATAETMPITIRARLSTAFDNISPSVATVRVRNCQTQENSAPTAPLATAKSRRKKSGLWD